MKINNVLTMFREAELFKYLTSLSHVNQMTVKVCQSLLNSLTNYSWTTVQRLSRTLRQQDGNVKFADVEQVVNNLLKRGILIQQDSRVMFKARLAVNNSAASQPASPSSSSSSSSSVTAQSASATVQSSSKSSSSSASHSSASGSSEEDWVTDQLDGDSNYDSASDSGLSPLSSYFASVNATLNDDYLKSSTASMTRHNDHLVDHSDLVRSDSVSSSVKRSLEASASKHQSAFATTPVSSKSSTSSSSSSVNSGLTHFHSNQTSESSGVANHDKMKHNIGQKFQAIARSLFKRISFMALMSHPSKVHQLAKAQFNLVVAARKYEGIRQADNLFKYEFKMNYQKFGKIGNRINNYLMKDVSSHNR